MSTTRNLLLTFEALLFLVGVRLVVAVKHFPALHKVVESWPTRRRLRMARALHLEELIEVVHRASIYLPFSTHCLLYSASLVLFLRSCGHRAELVIGVHHRPFEGHAWVEGAGRVLGPAIDLEEYTVIERI